jgi:hypothetical protein
LRGNSIIGTFAYYASALLLVTGVFILIFDSKRYDEKAKIYKLQIGARVLGVLNLCLGVVVFIGNWIYEKWFWG